MLPAYIDCPVINTDPLLNMTIVYDQMATNGGI